MIKKQDIIPPNPLKSTIIVQFNVNRYDLYITRIKFTGIRYIENEVVRTIMDTIEIEKSLEKNKLEEPNPPLK